MMESVLRVDGHGANAGEGAVVFDSTKAPWTIGLITLSLILGPLTVTTDAFLMFLVLTYTTLLIGHSVGMHRMMIHRTFECPKWVERTFIYAGVLVGMGGPYSMVRIHDLRDWAQRQPCCHDYFAHKAGYWRDLLWQLAYKFEFERAPTIVLEPNLREDGFYRFLERTWRWHQLAPAIPLYLIGGLSWVVWGICVRVAVSVVGHWTVTYLCHHPGPGAWRVKGAYVQASNLPGLGFLTYGECWHNNHHAFPESARIGLEPGQCDPAWRVIQTLKFFGLVSNVRLPRAPEEREDLDCCPNSREDAPLTLSQRPPPPSRWLRPTRQPLPPNYESHHQKARPLR